MPRSDDANDFLHTFTSEGEGKSKSTRIAPLEVGRDDAPARLLALDELGSGSIRTPPTGTRLLHFDSAGELVSETGSGTTEEVRGADDLVTLTGSPVPVGSGTNLELEQGQSIQDDTGSNRVTVGASDVTISTLDVNTFSTTPRFDQGLQVDQGEAIQDDSGTSRVSINSGDVGIPTADVGSFSTEPTFSAGLAVNTGEDIEDGSGDLRLAVTSNSLDLAAGDGSFDNQLFLRQDGDSRISTDGSLTVRDTAGGFDGLFYSASSSAPGTLSVSNAVIAVGGSPSSTQDSSRPHIYTGGGLNNTRLGDLVIELRSDAFANRDVVFVSEGEKIAQLENNGDLKIEGSLTENASLPSV